ncbi:MAG: acetyl-CoA carboxylase biotin carboxyl carrier protein [Firmicutes bacterium]|nr:acetyl-CoA carboxylase biotin carboxyl carrier protein [Bacillota bacterium]
MNVKEIKDLVKILDGTDITEFTYESEGSKIAIKKGASVPHIPHQAPLMQYPPVNMTALPASAPPAPQANQANEDINEGLGPNQVLIIAPMVGTFYRAPSPESEPYVQVGEIIEAGQVVCIIEAMKLMNEIESEWDGKIVQVLVENAQPVEYGQPLFVLEKI